MKFKFFGLFLFPALIMSCDHGSGSSTYQTEFTNNSGHNVKITPYSGGVADVSRIVTLAVSEQKVVTVGGGKWSQSETYCYCNISPIDSIVVSFDGTDSISHCNAGVISGTPKSYTYPNLRNIANLDHYQTIIAYPGKRHNDYRYLFTFTAQDFLDASN